MLVRSKRDGQLFEAFTWKWNGPKYCSWCGSRLDVDAIFTRHTMYHPLHRKPGVVAMCAACFPVEVVDHPGQPIPVDFRETEQVEIPVVRENTPMPDGWERDLSRGEYAVHTTVQNGIQKALRRVFQQ